MRTTRRRGRTSTGPPPTIVMDDDLLALRAQAEGRSPFVRDEYYEQIHERVNEDSKALWKLLPTVRLKFNFYMTARRLAESLKEEVPA
jgi:hypothetical protein